MPVNSDKPESQGGLILSALLPAAISHIKSAPSLPEASALAGTGSVAVAGDNNGSIINFNAQSVTIVEQKIAQELPSYLSKVVARFSEDLSEYNSGPKRTLPPEVNVKLSYNNFPLMHHIITDYSRYSNVLEATYRGVEQRNDDARRLVRRRAAVAYAEQLHKLCTTHGVNQAHAHDFARSHAVPLVMEAVAALLADFSAGSTAHVMQEVAHLAVCLIVADAVIECEVLERPVDVAAT